MYKKMLFTVTLALLAQVINSQNIESASYARFTENKGQWPANIKFMSKLNGGELWVDNDGLTLNFMHPEDREKLEEAHHGHALMLTDKFRTHAYKMKFVSSDATTFKGKNAESDYENFYLGKDKTKWVSKASVSKEIEIKNATEGIDYHLYTKDGNLKYDIIVRAGVDSKLIHTEYEGVEKIFLKNGDLHLQLSNGEVIEKAPIAYQNAGENKKVNVPVKFKVIGNSVYYDLGEYDHSKELVIDPTLIFSSYSGSTTDNWGYTATYDNSGNLYGGSIAFGLGYPTTVGAFLTTFTGLSIHAGITKFNSTGSTLLFSTYLGGSNSDAPHSLVVDGSDNLIVMGTTSSTDFPVTASVFDPTFTVSAGVIVNGVSYANGSDIFISKFNSTGTGLLASTLIGGNGTDGLNMDATLSFNYGDESRGEVIVDAAGNIYVCSSTLSTDFPTTAGALATTPVGLQDGCAFKMDPTLSTLLWSTYIGGTLADGAYSIKVGTNGRAYICGGTRSTNFPTTAGALTTLAPGGIADGFVIALNDLTGASVVSTYLGTNNYDQVYLLDMNIDNEVFVVGQSKGTYPVTAGVYSNVNGRQFIHKMNPELSTTIFSTIFGSGTPTINISPTALLVDNCQNIYVSGWGGTVNSEGNTIGLPVTADALDATTDGSDFYFIVLEGNATALLYGTFFGGSPAEHVDGGTSRFDKNGTIYQAVCAGCGSSDAFPTTTGVWSNVNGSSNCNLGVFKIEFIYTGIDAVANASPNIIACDPPFDVTFTGSSGAVDHIWDFGDGGTSTLLNPTHTFTDTGSYTIMYIAIDSSTCNIADTAYLSVIILEPEVFDADILIPPYDPCVGGPLTIDLAFTGSGADYLSWDMGDGTIYIGDTVISHTYTVPGNYIIEMYAYDSTCGLSGTITDTVFYSTNVLNVTADASPDVFTCDPPYPVTFSNGGSTAPDHFWNFDDGIGTSTLANPTYTFTATGTYNVMYVGIDSATCNITDTAYAVVVVMEPEDFSAEFTFIPPPPCTDTLYVDLQFTGTGADSLIWNMGDGTIFTDNTTVNYFYVTPGVYTVTLTAYDFVCNKVESFSSTLTKEEPVGGGNIIIPNIFSPNGDGINDEFYIGYAGVPNAQSMEDMEVYEFKIYNRWGTLVFDNEGTATAWDGKIKGDIASEGVYFCIVQYKRICGDADVIEYKGHLTLSK